MTRPPPRPSHPPRAAGAFNLLLPGTGLIRLGHRVPGFILLSLFAISFVGVLALFLTGYAYYLTALLDGNVFEPGRLERMADGFRAGWLAGFGLLGTLVYVTSIIWFAAARRTLRRPPKE